MRNNSAPPLSDPRPEADWEVWYWDTFDREMPHSREVGGRGLVNGLVALWTRYLGETIRPEGYEGFSRFYLRIDQAPGLTISGPLAGAVRLRGWIFSEEKGARSIQDRVKDQRLLDMLASTHALLLQAGKSSELLLAAAAEAVDRQTFEAMLSESA